MPLSADASSGHGTFTVTVETMGTTGSRAPRILAFFEKIADEESWAPEGELAAHIKRATYFGLWSRHGGGSESETLAGGLQLTNVDEAGLLPCHRVWPEIAFGDGKPHQSFTPVASSAAHISMLAIDEKWRARSGGLFWLLTAAMWRHCVLSGIRELWLEATPRTMRCYERFGWPLKIRGELREHWGEDCYLCSLAVRDVAGALAERAVRSQSYRRVLQSMVNGIQTGL